jgi:hypothetical protein
MTQALTLHCLCLPIILRCCYTCAVLVLCYSMVPIQDNKTDNSHSMFRIMFRRGPPSIQQLQQIPTVFIICNQHAREVRSQRSSRPCAERSSIKH